MAKAMSKSGVAAALAESVGVTKKDARAFLEALASIAYKEAANGFTIPGIGKLVLKDRKARMGRNPATGEAIKIAAKPASTVVKVAALKALKDTLN